MRSGHWRDATFHEHFTVRHRIPAHEGILTHRFKYTRYVDEGNHEFLHDLKNDPDELVNLAADPAHAATLEQMRARTDRTVARLGGPLAPPKKEFTLSTEPHPTASAAVTNKPGADGFADLLRGNRLGT